MLIVKLGESETMDWQSIAEDINDLRKEDQLIIVHAASKQRDKLALELGHPTRTVVSPSGVSSVYTDERALEIFLMAYPGLVNKQIVASLQSYGVPAVGLSGVDGGLWRAKRKDKVLVAEDGKVKALSGNLTGRVETINAHLLQTLVAGGYVPIVCAPALSTDFKIVNTDNDTGAAVMARELGAERMVFLFPAPGLLAAFPDEASLIKHISLKEIDSFLEHAHGRMKKKVLAAAQAARAGVGKIYFSDVRVHRPITNALAGAGTSIY